MRISGNTVLITGGSSGIGFALARQLTALGNTVIVTGRHAPALGLACERLPAAHAIQSDVSDPHAIAKLYRTVVRDYPQLNVVINNAGVMRKLQGMENDRLKIRPGLSNVLKLMSRVAPGFMLCRLSIRCSGARQGVGATIVP